MVGVNRYPRTGNNLLGCVEDSLEWEAALTARGFRVERLTDARATAARVTTALTDLFDRAADSTAVFVFSGHGSYVPGPGDRQENILCTTDIMTGSFVRESSLRALVTGRGSRRRTVLIIDACFAGGFGTRADPRARTRFLPPEVFLPSPSFVGAQASSRRRSANHSRMSFPTAVLLAACRADEQAHEVEVSGQHHGAFSRAALTTLTRSPAPASYRVWHRETKERVEMQEPQLVCSSARKDWSPLE